MRDQSRTGLRRDSHRTIVSRRTLGTTVTGDLTYWLVSILFKLWFNHTIPLIATAITEDVGFGCKP